MYNAPQRRLALSVRLGHEKHMPRWLQQQCAGRQVGNDRVTCAQVPNRNNSSLAGQVHGNIHIFNISNPKCELTLPYIAMDERQRAREHLLNTPQQSIYNAVGPPSMLVGRRSFIRPLIVNPVQGAGLVCFPPGWAAFLRKER